MRCPILIGREGPVSLMADAVRLLRGHAGGGALVVVGEAGVGKTRLAEYLSDAAARAGIGTIHGRALPEGVGGPLRPVAEMLLDLTRDRAAPPDPGPHGNKRCGALRRVLSRPRRIARYSPHYARGDESTARIGYRL